MDPRSTKPGSDTLPSAHASERDPRTKTVLHVGCGVASPGKLHDLFGDNTWREVRLDIDANVQPDIVSSITDMQNVGNSCFDALFSSHNLEHLYPHEVPAALREFRRVLKPDGFALITLPDLQEIARLITDGQLAKPAYLSPAGPITALDMLYGFSPALAQGNPFMGHRTGFTGQTLTDALASAGFHTVAVQRNPYAFCLWAIAFPTPPDGEFLADIRDRAFPLRRGMMVPQREKLPA